MKTIEITISADGKQVSVEADGFVGPHCLNTTDSYNNLFKTNEGSSVSENKQVFYQSDECKLTNQESI